MSSITKSRNSSSLNSAEDPIPKVLNALTAKVQRANQEWSLTKSDWMNLGHVNHYPNRHLTTCVLFYFLKKPNKFNESNHPWYILGKTQNKNLIEKMKSMYVKNKVTERTNNFLRKWKWWYALNRKDQPTLTWIRGSALVHIILPNLPTTLKEQI